MELNIDKTGWKKVKFGEVCRQVNETARNPQEEGLIHVVGLEHVGSNDLHIRSWNTLERETTFTRKFVKGQVLFGRRRAYQAKVAYAEFDGICSGDILVFEAIKSKLLPELLPFMVQSQKFYNKAVETSAGSLSPRTKFKDLADLEFLLPPKDQQARLAELLWAADEVVEREKEVKERLEMKLNSLFHDSFNKTKVNSKLSDCILRMIGGGTPDTSNSEFYNTSDSKLPWITTTSLGYLSINEGEKYISELALKKSTTNLLDKGNIIIGTRVGVGKCSINLVEMCFSQDCTGIVPNLDIIIVDYLLFHLRSIMNQTYFRERSRGTTIKGITKEDLLNTPFYIPAIKEQKKIIDKFHSIYMALDYINKQIIYSQQLKQGLINEIF